MQSARNEFFCQNPLHYTVSGCILVPSQSGDAEPETPDGRGRESPGKDKTMTDIEKMRITQSDEYKTYLRSLCRLASSYVSRIRVQFAEKAFEKYQNETIRRLVLAYGEEIEKLDNSRLFDFTSVSEHGATTPERLEDTCLNNARHYSAAIKLLFDIC